MHTKAMDVGNLWSREVGASERGPLTQEERDPTVRGYVYPDLPFISEF